MTRLSRILLPPALAVIVALIGFHPLVRTDWIFGKGDAYHYFTPLWHARDSALRAGQLPLWTDDVFMGAPLMADSQLGTLYPPNWLTVGLPAWDALKASVLIHVAWAALGAYLLARRVLGVGMTPALIASAVFALGGYIGAHAEQINQLQGIAWMPWAALSFQLPVASHQFSVFSRQSSVVRVLALGGVLAMIALSGHTQTLFITGVGLGVLALVLSPPKSPSPSEGRGGFDSASLPSLHISSQLKNEEQHDSPSPRLRGRGGWGVRGIILRLAILALAALLALILAAVQILPTLELTGLSNRSAGFSGQAAMAFSWNPNLAARGLLPSLGGQVFGEYVAYLGVFGLMLALWGALYGGRRRWPWLVLAGAGVFLAFGLYNPVYWLLAELPGFNLFRVPARWLGLFALGGAMLAALGADALLRRAAVRPLRGLITVAGIVLALAILAVWRSPAAAVEVDGSAVPTLLTLVLWVVVGVGFVVVVVLTSPPVPRRTQYIASLQRGEGELRMTWFRRSLPAVLAVITLAELGVASLNMPHTDLVDPMAATDPRLTSYQLFASTPHPPTPSPSQAGRGEEALTPSPSPSGRGENDTRVGPPRPSEGEGDFGGGGRVLSISLGYFDTYDHTALTERYARIGMSERAAKAGLTAAKLKELLAPNFPLLYGIPSADGFGGGLLPTVYYTAFTSLILPDGTPRTTDGRLRELLARPACLGACVPEDRWLRLMGVGYLILDKTADRFYDDVQFDVSLPLALDAGESRDVRAPSRFVADQAHLLVAADSAEALTLTVNERPAELIDSQVVDDGLTLLRYGLGEPEAVDHIVIEARAPLIVRALSLADSRTGVFDMVTLGGWEKALSSDIKLYRTLDSIPAAFDVTSVAVTTDDWNGSEAALRTMRDPAFDPSVHAVLHGAPESLSGTNGGRAGVAQIARTDTRIEYAVNVPGNSDAVLVFPDAYFPGWTAEIDGQAAPLYRADVMFRAVAVSPGAHILVIEYRPPWLQPLLVFGAAVWVVFGLAWLAMWGAAPHPGRD